MSDDATNGVAPSIDVDGVYILSLRFGSADESLVWNFSDLVIADMSESGLLLINLTTPAGTCIFISSCM